MKQYEGIVIDETKLSVGDLLSVILDGSAPNLLAFADKAIVGGIKELPLADFPKVLTAIMRFLHENQEEISIAIASMNNFLKGDE